MQKYEIEFQRKSHNLIFNSIFVFFGGYHTLGCSWLTHVLRDHHSFGFKGSYRGSGIKWVILSGKKRQDLYSLALAYQLLCC